MIESEEMCNRSAVFPPCLHSNGWNDFRYANVSNSALWWK